MLGRGAQEQIPPRVMTRPHQLFPLCAPLDERYIFVRMPTHITPLHHDTIIVQLLSFF